MDSDLFKGIIKWNIERNGTNYSLPGFYRDNFFMTAILTASTNKIKEKIPHPDLHPVEVIPGRCLIALTAFEYRKPEIAPYNEFSIAFVVSYRKKPLPLLMALRLLASPESRVYVWKLPVTTEEARVGGVDLFNYPKFIADINFLNEPDDSVTCILGDSGSEILRMTGRKIKTGMNSPLCFISYTYDNGILLSINQLINPTEYGSTLKRDAIHIQIGNNHPISRELIEMKIGKRPFAYQYCPSSEIILFPARNVLDK